MVGIGRIKYLSFICESCRLIWTECARASILIMQHRSEIMSFVCWCGQRGSREHFCFFLLWPLSNGVKLSNKSNEGCCDPVRSRETQGQIEGDSRADRGRLEARHFDACKTSSVGKCVIIYLTRTWKIVPNRENFYFFLRFKTKITYK